MKEFIFVQIIPVCFFGSPWFAVIADATATPCVLSVPENLQFVHFFTVTFYLRQTSLVPHNLYHREAFFYRVSICRHSFQLLGRAAPVVPRALLGGEAVLVPHGDVLADVLPFADVDR